MLYFVFDKNLERFFVKRLILAILALQMMIGFASAATLYVDDEGVFGNYTTIQSAVDHSRNGDTIYVNGGTYPETVVITQSALKFQGKDYPQVYGFTNSPLITGDGDGQWTQYESINGFSITETGIVLGGEFSDGITIRNNYFSKKGIEIESVASSNTKILNNQFAGCGISIKLAQNSGPGILLTGNKISNSDTGISLSGAGNLCSEIAENMISGCNIGLRTDEAAGVGLIYNNLFNNSNNVDVQSGSTIGSWNLGAATKTKNIAGGANLGGNFWGSPSGNGFSQTHFDITGDGISEEPYIIDSKNADYLPLGVFKSGSSGGDSGNSGNNSGNNSSGDNSNNGSDSGNSRGSGGDSGNDGGDSGSTDSSSSGSSGSHSSGGSSHKSSSGGGGAGGSPEPQKNVEIKELSQTFITSGKTAQFDFSKNATCVVAVTLDSKKTFGKMTTIAEQLKNKSALVSDLPAGEVYKSFNVWVGNGGIASSKNIENPYLTFRVSKAWITDNNIDPASIALNWYSDKKWNKLTTEKISEDSEFIYFKSNVTEYSSFVITGEKQTEKIESESSLNTSPGEVKISSDIESIKTDGSEEKSPISPVIAVISILLGAFFRKTR